MWRSVLKPESLGVSSDVDSVSLWVFREALSNVEPSHLRRSQACGRMYVWRGGCNGLAILVLCFDNSTSSCGDEGFAEGVLRSRRYCLTAGGVQAGGA